MFKKIFCPLLLLALFFTSVKTSSALDRPHFVTFVNSVRGLEAWPLSQQTPLVLPQYQYYLASQNAFPVTWLLRFDALSNATISAYLKTISATDSSQTLGALFEITPKLTDQAGVQYPPGEQFTAANRLFLSGYDPADRLKLIDIYMKNFYDVFGYYPQVVGAFHLDSFSLNYLQRHYSVIAAVEGGEQYNSGHNRLWGGYLDSPYFPNKINFLVPATTRDNRIDVAITRGFGLENLTYPEQNFNEFTQQNVGADNDRDLNSYQTEIKKTYETFRANAKKNDLRFISLIDFGQWLKTRYTFTNPAFFYQSKDTYWYQNPFYRLGLKSNTGHTSIIDFRLYNQKEAEENFLTRNIDSGLYAEINPLIDSLKYPDTSLSLDINLEKAKISFDRWQVIFKEGDKELRLQPEKIAFTGFSAPVINTEEIKVTKLSPQTLWNLQAKLPFSGNPSKNFLAFSGILVFALLLLKKGAKNKPLLISGWLMSAVTLITVWQSGLVYPFGLGLWGPNGHDAIFHLSLGEHFRENPLSLLHPQIAGKLIQNYHFAFDWISGLFAKITTISLLDLYFRLLPLLIIIALVFTLTKLLALWRFTKVQTLLSFFFVFFAGSAGYIGSFILKRSLSGGESIFWANQSISLLLNPPFALSLLVLVLFLYLFEKKSSLNPKTLIFLSLIGGFLAQIKVYAFILLLLALFIKKQFRLCLGISLVGLLLLLPSLSGNGSPFVLNPLWFPRSMFEAFDRLYWPRLAQAWQTYENNGALSKLILVNFFALIVFYFGNLWVRLIGLRSLPESLVKYIVLLGLIIPLIFTQKVNPWNTIQFMYYSIFFLGIFTAQQLGHWISSAKNKWPRTLICLFLVALSLPTTIGTLRDYLTPQSASRISLTELHALDLLRREPPGIVVSPLTYNRYLPAIPNPKPLYVYASTAYISAFSGHSEYLSDTINLDITGFVANDRIKNILRLYRTRDSNWVKQFLESNQIKYLYETPFDKIQIKPEAACLIKIFDSREINIYKYACHGQN